MDEITMQTFPSNEIEALAMLYVQRQDLSDVTPSGLLDLYQDAYNEISEHIQRQRESNEIWL